MNNLYVKMLIIAAAFAVGFCASRFMPDNPVEQVAEQVVKEETGLDVDFSPEKGKNK